jgi:predicted ATPase
LNGAGKGYPFEIPSIRSLLDTSLELHPKVTFLMRKNGSGKSTLLEGIADQWGFASQSGSRSQSLGLRNYETALAHELVISKAIGIRPMDGLFFELRVCMISPRSWKSWELKKGAEAEHG